MPGLGIEPMIPLFERAKTIQTLDSAATVITELTVYIILNCY
jgi:hypothetical protein